MRGVWGVLQHGVHLLPALWHVRGSPGIQAVGGRRTSAPARLMSTGGAYAGRTDVITLHGQCAATLEACEASQARRFVMGTHPCTVDYLSQPVADESRGCPEIVSMPGLRVGGRCPLWFTYSLPLSK